MVPGPDPEIDDVKAVAAEVDKIVVGVADLVKDKGADKAVEVSKLVEEVVDHVDSGDVFVDVIEEVNGVGAVAKEVNRLVVVAVETEGNRTRFKLTGIGAGGCC